MFTIIIIIIIFVKDYHGSVGSTCKRTRIQQNDLIVPSAWSSVRGKSEPGQCRSMLAAADPLWLGSTLH